MLLAPAADLLILDADGEPAATVEAAVAPPPWVDGWGAVEADLLAAAEEDRARFAVLVTLTRLAVWKERTAAGAWEQTADADAGPLVRPMVERSGLPMKMVDSDTLESLLSTTWIVLCSGRPERAGSDFVSAAEHVGAVSPGLLEAVRRGRILMRLSVPDEPAGVA